MAQANRFQERSDHLYGAYSRGGVSLASEAEYLDASLSASLVSISGVGGFSPVDLDKVLAGRIANASAYVSTYTHGISGGSTPAISKPRCSSCICTLRPPITTRRHLG